MNDLFHYLTKITQLNSCLRLKPNYFGKRNCLFTNASVQQQGASIFNLSTFSFLRLSISVDQYLFHVFLWSVYTKIKIQQFLITNVGVGLIKVTDTTLS